MVKNTHNNLLTDDNTAEEILHSMSTQGTTAEQNIIQDYTTNMLESAMRSESPLASV